MSKECRDAETELQSDSSDYLFDSRDNFVKWRNNLHLMKFKFDMILQKTFKNVFNEIKPRTSCAVHG